MKALAVETTGELKSLACAEDGRLLAEDSFAADLLTEFWPRLDGFLKRNGFRFRDFDVFAVCRGPGSWTGLRFGLAVAKGLACGTGRKVFALSAGELAAAVLPGHTPAAALACRCGQGEPPEDIKVEYGSLPKFRKIEIKQKESSS